MKRPEHEFWFKWWPNAWRSDPALAACSAAARGVWTELIMCMREGVPPGHLTRKDGTALPMAELARITRLDRKELAAGMEELLKHGVFSLGEHGVPFSRRIVREMQLSSTRSKAAKGRQAKYGVTSFANTNEVAIAPAKEATKPVFCLLSSNLKQGESEGESPAFGAADALLAALLANNPGHEHQHGWEVAWRAKYASDLLLIGKPWERVLDVIAWYQTDDFWPGAISDSVTFVRNFRSIETKMLATKKKAAASNAKPNEPRLKTPDELAAGDPEAAERLRQIRARYEGAK